MCPVSLVSVLLNSEYSKLGRKFVRLLMSLFFKRRLDKIGRLLDSLTLNVLQKLTGRQAVFQLGGWRDFLEEVALGFRA